MLFWAEGSRSVNAVKLTNSDPALLRVFTEFLRVHRAIQEYGGFGRPEWLG